jgi:hypothetical protein
LRIKVNHPRTSGGVSVARDKLKKLVVLIDEFGNEIDIRPELPPPVH